MRKNRQQSRNRFDGIPDDQYIVYEGKLGEGLKFLVITLSVVFLIGIGVFGGVTWYKYDLSENTNERLKLDSEADVQVRKTDDELMADAAKWVANNKTHNADGTRTDEFMQYLQSQRTVARKRGDSRDIIERTADLQVEDLYFWRW